MLDIVLFHNREHYDSQTLQEELMKIFSLRDSEIKARCHIKDLEDKWTYVSRRYPTIKAADCNHEVEYRVRIILADEAPEKCHLMIH